MNNDDRRFCNKLRESNKRWLELAKKNKAQGFYDTAMRAASRYRSNLRLIKFYESKQH